MGNSRIKITKRNLEDYRVGPSKRIKLKEHDIAHIVYGEDIDGFITGGKPKTGTTPFLKVPEDNTWFKIFKIDAE